MAKADMKSPRIKGMTLIIILIVAVVAAGALTVASVYLNGSSTKTASLTGVLTVYPSASGPVSSANSASYNVTVNAKDGNGTLLITQISGESDLIPDHNYTLTDVLVSPYNVTMMVSGSNVSLGWITTSTLWSGLNSSYATASGVSSTGYWNDLNSSYVAASGPDTPSNVTVGEFSPSVFHLPTSYNMFIGITIPIQPANNIPFAIAPIIPVNEHGEA